MRRQGRGRWIRNDCAFLFIYIELVKSINSLLYISLPLHAYIYNIYTFRIFFHITSYSWRIKKKKKNVINYVWIWCDVIWCVGGLWINKWIKWNEMKNATTKKKVSIDFFALISNYVHTCLYIHILYTCKYIIVWSRFFKTIFKH